MKISVAAKAARSAELPQSGTKPLVTEEIEQAFNAAQAFSLPRMDAAEEAARIENAAREEAKLATIVLRRDGLTPGMLRWCAEPVVRKLAEWHPLRNAFLTRIEPYQHAIDVLEKLPIQEAEAEAKTARLKSEAVENARHKTEFDSAESELIDAQQNFKRHYEEAGQKPARIFPVWAYWLILASVSLAEIFINYEAFLNYFEVPAIAAGITFAVMVIIALASEWHGRATKQREYMFSARVDKSRRATNLRALGIVSALFIAALTLVGYSRYHWAMMAIAATSGTGALPGIVIAGPSINIGQSVGFSLIGNLLIWGIGVILFWLTHDYNPDYVEATLRHRRAKARYEKAYKKHVEKAIEEEEDKLRHEIERLKNVAKAQSADTRRLRDMRSQINAHEAALVTEATQRINSAIADYRHAVCVLAEAENPKLRLLGEGEPLTPAIYRGMSASYTAAELRQAAGLPAEKTADAGAAEEVAA
ncbi:hypothetical protein [Ferrovibrio sp.]|uniref:hypothetical protein n=1 Tax=Ferrovibrio sp. TaxID=1917215 RepID=UPI0025BD3531|nr:hypothetical protein [Ferrovibrio sp.]MBX3455167.1 hypothetical protein [Ferrovibrio sp.]